MRQRLWPFLILLVILIVVVDFFFEVKSLNEVSVPVAEENTEIVDNMGTGVDEKSELTNDSLEKEITALSNADSTHYSVYIAYPEEARHPYIYQSHSMRSASMIKMFLLAAAMEKVKIGDLSLDMDIVIHHEDKVGGSGVLCGYLDETKITLDKLLRLMITESDNTATNILIDLLGMENINDYITQNGYSDTRLARKMMDFAAVKAGKENYTSVFDLGNLFNKIHRHECVSPELDDMMLSYLQGQTDRECFPTALPEAVIAHKTGELNGVYDDGGIINLDGRILIVVIMTENYSNRNKAIETMKSMVRAAVR